MEEVTNVSFSINLVLVLRNGGILGRVLIEELSPLFLVALNLVNDVLEEAGGLIVELMLGQGQDVEPHLLVHPRELLVTIIDT